MNLKNFVANAERWLFANKTLVLSALAAVTVFFAWFAVQLHLEAGYEKQIPIGHEYVAMGLFWGAFINMGQNCACANRLYVHESIYDTTMQALKELAQGMPMGNGLDHGMVMGPIQNKMQCDKVVNLLESAKLAGGTIMCGGRAAGGVGYFYPLTLVTGLHVGDRLVDEEQFGPVLPIIKYQDVDEAVASANRLSAGLGASVWLAHVERAKEVVGRIQAGTVWINQHSRVHPMVPFGGIKGSGYDVEFGVEGLKAVTRPQVISMKK